MKKRIQRCFPVMAMLLAAFPAFAETGARTDNSMTLVYLFLGVCGLIIFLQLIPVFAMGFGIIKGIFGEQKASGKPVVVKNR